MNPQIFLDVAAKYRAAGYRFDLNDAVEIYLDAAQCGRGWKGIKGKCKRAKAVREMSTADKKSWRKEMMAASTKEERLELAQSIRAGRNMDIKAPKTKRTPRNAEDQHRAQADEPKPAKKRIPNGNGKGKPKPAPETGEEQLSPRQVSARKAAATRKANREAAAKAKAEAEQATPPETKPAKKRGTKGKAKPEAKPTPAAETKTEKIPPKPKPKEKEYSKEAVEKFESDFYGAFEKANSGKNYQGLVPLSEIRKGLGKSVTDEDFNALTLKMQERDGVQLTRVEDPSEDEAKGGISTELTGNRTHAFIPENTQRRTAKPKKEPPPEQGKVAPQEQKPAGSKAKPIKEYKSFQSEAMKAFDEIDKAENFEGLVPIYKVREALGDNVSRDQFNDWLLEMQGDDLIQLQGGSLPQRMSTPKNLENSVTTELSGLRTYMRRIKNDSASYPIPNRIPPRRRAMR